MKKTIIHKHSLIKAFVKTPPVKEEELNKWLTDLVDKIGMKVVIPARSFFVPDEGNEGLTGQIALSTSHIAAHVWSELKPARIELDVYSCAEYDPLVIVDHLRDAFGLLDYELLVIDRNGGFKVVRHDALKGIKK